MTMSQTSDEPTVVKMECTTDTEKGSNMEVEYSQDLQRKFSILSLLAMAFSSTNSWLGIALGMITGINSGGPVLLIYGLIFLGVISFAVASSLAELASIYPNAGGQYYWAKMLAPKKFAPFISYLTGWCGYAAAIFASASVLLAVGEVIVGLYQLSHPDFVIQAWHVVVTYELFNLFVSIFNTWGKVLPAITTTSLFASLSTFFIILVAVPASAPNHNPAKFVFTEFINTTGWELPGMAFILGLVNTNWAYVGLDATTHLAEEVSNPERVIPKVLFITVAIGFVTAWVFAISMMFSLGDLISVSQTPTLVPIIAIMDQAINRAGAIGLGILIVITVTGCEIGVHTWQARLCWSFARDGGFPGHQWLRRTKKELDAPLTAHAVSVFLNGLIGLLYLGSSAGLNSVITATVTLSYISYSIPVACLLIKGRNNVRHGPFWLGKLGAVANVVLITWTLFCFVIFSFPTTRPVTSDSMNYVSVVYVLVGLILTCDWFIRGRYQYRGLETSS